MASGRREPSLVRRCHGALGGDAGTALHANAPSLTWKGDPKKTGTTSPCPRRELNPRPHPELGTLIPLSYGGDLPLEHIDPYEYDPSDDHYRQRQAQYQGPVDRPLHIHTRNARTSSPRKVQTMISSLTLPSLLCLGPFTTSPIRFAYRATTPTAGGRRRPHVPSEPTCRRGSCGCTCSCRLLLLTVMRRFGLPGPGQIPCPSRLHDASHMPVPAERTRIGFNPVGIGHTIQGQGMVVRPVLAVMCHLAIAGGLRAAGDPGEKLPE